MESVNIVLAWLKETDIPLSKIAKTTGISRKSLYNWKKGGEPTVKSYQKLKEYYYNLPSVKGEDIELTADGSIDADYVIELQQKRIKSLEEEKAKAVAENLVWDTLDYHIEQSLKLKWNWTDPLKIKRAYFDLGDLKVITRKLGWTKSELLKFYHPEVYYPMNEHPVNTMLAPATVNYLQNTTRTHFVFFTSMKTFVNQHFFPLSLEFLCRDGGVHNAISYIRLSKDFVLTAKTKFLNKIS
jgi:transcriptional regulator with XRE-family HTH domain